LAPSVLRTPTLFVIIEVWHAQRHFHTGKSAAGHTFPDALSVDKKQAVLEYLKTL
jgi:hypothetical protein